MSLNAEKILRAVPVAVFVIGLLSVVKYLFLEFSLNDAEGRNLLLRVCLFALFCSVSISGLIAMAKARVAWMALLLAQLVSTIILVTTMSFGRGALMLNTFTLQHFIVAAVSLVLLILLDVKYKAGKQ